MKYYLAALRCKEKSPLAVLTSLGFPEQKAKVFIAEALLLGSPAISIRIPPSGILFITKNPVGDAWAAWVSDENSFSDTPEKAFDVLELGKALGYCAEAPEWTVIKMSPLARPAVTH